jgi:hypothetical protein
MIWCCKVSHPATKLIVALVGSGLGSRSRGAFTNDATRRSCAIHSRQPDHTRPAYRQQSLVLTWIDYATTKSEEMESAAKRKAANAGVGDGDARPAKRQKVPVRAAPKWC